LKADSTVLPFTSSSILVSLLARLPTAINDMLRAWEKALLPCLGHELLALGLELVKNFVEVSIVGALNAKMDTKVQQCRD
jgi:hypothetical protein